MSGSYDVDYSRQKRKVQEHGKGAGPILCKKRMGLSGSCKYCDQVMKLYNSDVQADKDMATRCRARSTFYMNIIDLKDKDAGVQVYACGVENWRDLLDRLPDPDDSEDEGIDYIKPSSARAVILKRKGKGLQTKYTISIGTKKISVKKSWLKDMVPLHKVVSMVDGDEIELWKPKVGKNRIYILPPWSKKAKGDFYFEAVYHWNTSDLILPSGKKDDDDDDDDFEDFEDGDDDGDDDIPY